FVIGNMQAPVGRYHIDMVGHEFGWPIDLRHWHLRAGRKDAREFAVALGRQVDDDNEGSAGFFRQCAKKRLESLHTARRGPDAHHGGSVLPLFFLPPLLFWHERVPSWPKPQLAMLCWALCQAPRMLPDAANRNFEVSIPSRPCQGALRSRWHQRQA